MVKIYICASFPRRIEAQILALRLSSKFEIVSTWHRDDTEVVPRHSDACLHRVRRDIHQIRNSELTIVFIGDSLSGGGRHTELGVALGMRKNIILIGEYDQNPFELIPYLRTYKSADDLVEAFLALQDNIGIDCQFFTEDE